MQAPLFQRRVLAVGDAMLDRYRFGAVDRIPPEAPLPEVRVTREEKRLGGAANVAMNVEVRVNFESKPDHEVLPQVFDVTRRRRHRDRHARRVHGLRLVQAIRGRRSGA